MGRMKDTTMDEPAGYGYYLEMLDAAKREIPAPSKPTLVYHYTGVDGLMGLLADREAWMTHYAYLNDRSEFEIARELLEPRLTELLSEHLPIDENLHMLIRAFSQFLRAPYVMSFSEAENDLNQWRAYADDGRGFAIGFRRDLRRAFPQDLQASTTLTNAIYDPAVQVRIVTAVFSVAERILANEPSHEDLINEVGVAINAAISQVAPAFKHSCFQDESEWRLSTPRVHLDNLDGDLVYENVRARQGALVPFLKIPLDADELRASVAQVWCGPRQEPRAAEQALRLFLRKNGYEAEVLTSDLPYRRP